MKGTFMTNTNNEQLELGFNLRMLRPAADGLQGRIPRANWWFSRMRNIVADAIDWSAAGDPRPEQIWMPGTTREVNV